MKSSVEQLNPTRVKITVEVPFAELEPDFDKAYKALAGQVNIPGFRPGKAPAKLLESRIGRPAVLEQVVNDMIPSRYSEAVDEHDLKVLAQPDIDVTKLEDGEVVEFTAEVDIRPEITLPTYSDLAVTVESPETDDAAVDAELDNLRARFGTLKGVERGATQGDFLSVDLAATVDGEAVEEASTEGLSYELGSGTLIDGLDDAAEGLKEGESKEFKSSLVAGDQAGKEAVITVTVQSVKERELPEADDDFAQMASEFDTLDELRADLVTKVAQQEKTNFASEIRDSVFDALLEATEVPVPEALVESEAHQQLHSIFGDAAHDDDMINTMLEAEGTDREAFEAEAREAAARGIRSQFLLDAVADDVSVDVSQEELMQHITLQSQRFGMDPNQFVQQIQQAGQLGSLFADVRRSKALGSVVAKVAVKDADGNLVDTTEFFGSGEDEDADAAAAEDQAAEGEPAESIDAAEADEKGSEKDSDA